ncbi:shikimate kinase [Actinomycetaceae bacterium L2_0104]
MSLLVLIGPPGALVAEVAGELSHRLSIPYADSEQAIATLTGRSAEQISVQGSEEQLRGIERDVALAFLNDLSADDARILALGSGSLGNTRADAEFAPVRTRLADLREQGAFVVHLSGDLATLVRRTGLDGPRIAAVSSPRRIFFTQMSTRGPLYEEMSSFTVDTSGLDVGEVTDAVLAAWRDHGGPGSGEERTEI